MTGRFVAYHAGLAFGGEGGIRTLIEYSDKAICYALYIIYTSIYINRINLAVYAFYFIVPNIGVNVHGGRKLRVP